jgi:hypothetical protein
LITLKAFVGRKFGDSNGERLTARFLSAPDRLRCPFALADGFMPAMIGTSPPSAPDLLYRQRVQHTVRYRTHGSGAPQQWALAPVFPEMPDSGPTKIQFIVLYEELFDCVLEGVNLRNTEWEQNDLLFISCEHCHAPETYAISIAEADERVTLM